MSDDQHDPTAAEAPAQGKGERAGQAEQPLFAAIESIQREVETLRQTAADQQREAAELLEKQNELSVRDAELERREQADRAHQAELDARKDALDEQEQSLGERTSQTQQVQAELAQQRQLVEQRQAELDEVAQGLSERQREVEAAQAEASAQDEKVREIQSRLDERDQTLAQHQAQLAEQSEELERRISDFDQQQADTAEIQARAEEACPEAEQRLASLSDLRSDLDERETELDKRDQEVRTIEAQFGSRDKALAEREQQADARLDEGATLDAELAERSRQIEQAGQRADEAIADFEQREAAIAQRESELAQQASQLAQNQETHLTAIKSLETEQSQHKAECERLAKETKELSARHSDLEKRAAQLDTAADAATKLAHATQQHEAELAQRDQCIKEMTAALDEVRGDTGGQIAKRDKAIEMLTEKCERLTAQTSELERAAKAAQAKRNATGGADKARMKLRRQRLKRVKHLLEDKAQQVLQAQQVVTRKSDDLKKQAAQSGSTRTPKRDDLAKRAAEMKQVSDERAELVEQKEMLREFAQRLELRTARNGASLVMFSVIATLGVIAGLSWYIAGQVAKPTFVARTTIEMEQTGMPAGSRAIESWTNFHSRLVTDPQLIEKVASRLKQRGYTELASPAELSAVLKENLTTDIGQGGRLTLAFRGEGSGHTERVLQTFAATLVNVANSARDRRLDKTATFIGEPAKSGADPVIDPRPRIAMIAAGALTLFASIVGLAAVGGISRSRKRGSEDRLPDDEAEWNIPAD